MADRKINILLGIKSQMAEGLASAKSSLASFGSSVVEVGKTIATGMVAAAAAVTSQAEGTAGGARTCSGKAGGHLTQVSRTKSC